MRSTRTMLEKAIGIALLAHEGQRDKAGQPYILHPLRVMQYVRTDQERIVAALHDVMEDGAITHDFLRLQGFPENIIDAVQLLTHSSNPKWTQRVKLQVYLQSIQALKASGNAIAINVKLADIDDNTSPDRMKVIIDIDPAQAARLERKYKWATDILNAKKCPPANLLNWKQADREMIRFLNGEIE